MKKSKITQTELNTLFEYSYKFNGPVDNLLKKLSRKYGEKKAKVIIRKAFDISLNNS